MSVIWNDAFEALPAAGDALSEGDDRIRDHKEAVREREIKEHEWKSSVAADGWHRAGSAKAYVQTGAPTLRPDGSTALTSDDTGRLWFDSNDTYKMHLYTGANFVSNFKMSNLALDVLTVGTLTVETSASISSASMSMASITGALTAGNLTIETNASVGGVLTATGGADIGGSGTTLKYKVVDIGDWNMDSSNSATVAHGLTDHTKVRSISIVIRDDNNSGYYQEAASGSVTENPISMKWSWDATNITMYRSADSSGYGGHGGQYDSSLFDATSYNRGWITIWYEI